jgi:hypothetical protein
VARGALLLYIHAEQLTVDRAQLELERGAAARDWAREAVVESLCALESGLDASWWPGVIARTRRMLSSRRAQRERPAGRGQVEGPGLRRKAGDVGWVSWGQDRAEGGRSTWRGSAERVPARCSTQHRLPEHGR